MLTCFFDFLTTPIITLCMGLIIIILTKQNRTLKDDIKDVIQYSIMWAIGYFGMWILKWTIADIVYNCGTWKSALDQFFYRVNGTHQKWGKVSVIEAIKGNLLWLNASEIEYGSISGTHAITIAVVMATVYSIKKLCFSSKLYNFNFLYEKLKANSVYAVPYIIIAFMPVMWYVILQNHSYFHSYFTYRNLLIFLLGINYFIFALTMGKKFENRS